MARPGEAARDRFRAAQPILRDVASISRAACRTMTLISAQPELFDERHLPRLSRSGAAVTPGEEQALTTAIDGADPRG